MKNAARLLCCFLLVFQRGADAQRALQQGMTSGQQQTTTPSIAQPVLEDGTPVKVRLAQTVSSEDAHVNDRVEFEVVEEIKIADSIVIPKGGIAWGTVTEAVPKKRLARGGKLEIVMDSVRLVDGEKAALRATKEAKGGGHTGAMTAGIVATAIVFWPAAPFFLFMHGKDITIPKGTEFSTFIEGNFHFDLAKFQQGAIVGSQAQVVSAQSGQSPQTPALANAELEVRSTPDDADILLDDAFVGSTPSTVGVSTGDHVLKVNKNGYKTWQRNIRITTGRIVVTAELEPGASAPALQTHTVTTGPAQGVTDSRSTVASGPPQYPSHVELKRILVNRDIVAMVRAKVGESIILETIKANQTNFDVSATAIVGLKNSGVSDAITKAMISATVNSK